MKATELKRIKREEAQERQEIRNGITDDAQILRLDAKFGIGKGAKKERTRLLKRIADSQPREKKSSDKDVNNTIANTNKAKAEKHNVELAEKKK